MGKMMNLSEIIDKIGSFDPDCTIYAVEPWTEASQGTVAYESESGDIPVEVQELGMKYFLEVFIAYDFLEAWIDGLNDEPTLQQKCSRLIQYAMTDA